MKALLDFLRSVLFTSPATSAGRLPIYVRCNRCAEALKTEINLQNDLSADYDTSGKVRYHVRKVITGSELCFQRIEVELDFDSRKRLIGENVMGGKRIDEQEFTRLSQAPEESG